MKFRSHVYSLMFVAALAAIAGFKPVYSATQALLFGSYMNSAKAVTVDSNGRLNVSVGAGSIAEASLSITDVTTGNVSITAHGFAPKLPNDVTKFLNGIGTYTVPPAGSDACTNANCSVTNLLFPASPSTSTTGILYKGTATAAKRFIHNYWDQHVDSSTSDSNIFIGTLSGNFTMAFGDANHNANDNIGIGLQTLQNCTTCGHMIAIGPFAGAAVTTAFQSIFIGENAGIKITTSSANTGVGKDVFFTNIVTSNSNSAFGIGACRDLSSGSCTGFGDHAGALTTTGNVTAFGVLAGSNSPTASGVTAIGDSSMNGASQNYTTALGGSSGNTLTTGNGQNVCLGYDSCKAMTTDDFSIAIGLQAGRSGGTPLTNIIAIGTLTKAAFDNQTIIGTATSTRFSTFGTNITTGAALAVADVGANSCGTTAATIVGNDNGGEITVGATAGTQCRVTFAVAAPTRRFCAANDDTTTTAVRVTYVDTTHTDFIGTFTAADHVSFVCTAN